MEEVKQSNYLGSMITNVCRYTKSRIAIAEIAFYVKKEFITGKFNVLLIKDYAWSVALHEWRLGPLDVQIIGSQNHCWDSHWLEALKRRPIRQC